VLVQDRAAPLDRDRLARAVSASNSGPEQWSVLAFDPGGSDLVAFYGDSTGLVWDVDPDRWKQRACTIAGGALSRDEWKELLPGRRYERRPATARRCGVPPCVPAVS
jgi:hypothetical protein